MKHYKLGIVLTLAALFVVTATASAQDMKPRREGMPLQGTTTPLKARPVEGDLEARKAEFRSMLDQKKQAVASRTAEFRKENALRHASTTARVLTATVDRLGKIVTRIESRIEKVESAGGAVTEAKAAIASAKVNLETARTDIKALLSIDLTGDNAQENFGKVKDAAKKVKDSIREAHTNLMKAVRSLNMSVLSEKKGESAE